MRAVLLIALLSLAVLSQRQYVEWTESRPLPSGWIQTGQPQPHKPLKLSLALKIRNSEDLEKTFWEVSNPNSAQYANYLSYEEVCDKYGAHEDDIAQVKAWLDSNGVEYSITKTKDFMHIFGPVSAIENMLQIKFHTFQHAQLPSITRSLDAYTLPNEIADLVHFITGINRFPTKRVVRLRRTKVSEADEPITPAVIKQIFNIGDRTGKVPTNLQSVNQFLQEYYNPSDLELFQKKYDLPVQPVAREIGPNDPKNPGGEASLDIEYMMGVAVNVPTWFWSTGGTHEQQEPFVEWAIDLNNSPVIPYVISVSYGDTESTITKSYADALNIQFQKIALRGSSVLFSSGDDGVGCDAKCIHEPIWPASSPYVTAVGGFVSANKDIVGDSISSGGFSRYYERPSYQASAVPGYLNNTKIRLPPASQYNSRGRAIPDISSFSEDVIIVDNGQTFPVGGTSCASPVFSAVISLINDVLLSNSKKTLGFLNPALYQIGYSNSEAFLDITTGLNNNGCCEGFLATKGWDPITGWGGPNFPQLLAAFQSFQS